MSTVISMLVLATVGPLSAAAGAFCIGWVNRFLAYAALKADPLYYVGAELVELRARGATVVGPCKITSIIPGRIELTGDGWKSTFSVQEFIQLDPVMVHKEDVV